MEQRIADLKAAGIANPTLGLASGNRLIGGIENLLQNTPGAIGVMNRAREGAIEGMRAKVMNAADAASPTRGADVAGTAIRNDLRGPLKDRVSQGYAGLNDALEQIIGRNAPTRVQSAITKAQQLTAAQPGAPATSALLSQPRIAGIGRALESDAGGMPAQTIISPILGPTGLPMQTQIPAVPPRGVPFRTLKELRTKIGGEGASNAIIGTPEQAQWKQVYGAMSDDMRGAAKAADMSVGPQRNNMGPAERTLNRANDFYRAGMQRIERVEPFATTKAPEEAFLALARSTREHVTTLQAVKKSVTPETRGKIAATIIDRLGRASPGAQNELSDVFSTERFLTNYNGMTPKARNELFSGFPGALNVRKDIDAAAKAASYMRDNSRMWANPSGTAAATTARALMLGAPLSAFVNPWAPAAVGGGLALSRIGAEALTSPMTSKWAVQRNRTPAMVPGALGGMQGSGLLGFNPAELGRPRVLDPLME